MYQCSTTFDLAKYFTILSCFGNILTGFLLGRSRSSRSKMIASGPLIIWKQGSNSILLLESSTCSKFPCMLFSPETKRQSLTIQVHSFRQEQPNGLLPLHPWGSLRIRKMRSDAMILRPYILAVSKGTSIDLLSKWYQTWHFYGI